MRERSPAGARASAAARADRVLRGAASARSSSIVGAALPGDGRVPGKRHRGDARVHRAAAAGRARRTSCSRRRDPQALRRRRAGCGRRLVRRVLPELRGLPVPTPLSQIHLGLLPTWNWGFQFGVNLDEPNRNPIDWLSVLDPAIAATTVVCIAAVYAVRNWHQIRGGTDNYAYAPVDSGHCADARLRARRPTSRRRIARPVRRCARYDWRTADPSDG